MRYRNPQENAFTMILQCLVQKALASLDARPTSLYETRRCGDDASLAVVVRRRNRVDQGGGRLLWIETQCSGAPAVPCRRDNDSAAGAGYLPHLPVDFDTNPAAHPVKDGRRLHALAHARACAAAGQQNGDHHAGDSPTEKPPTASGSEPPSGICASWNRG